jgi:hypothetical protein
MPMAEPLADLAGLSLAEIARLAAARKLPPVASWNPSHCGDSAMRIARDGIWYHERSPIGRPAMVRLFSTILRREPDGGFVLVTPVEKLTIEVEDAPFVAVELKSEGERTSRSLAYLHVRDGLDALVSRPVYYELAELAIAEAADPPGLWSAGAFFPMAAE